MASWTLVDASAIAVRHPYTFYKPDAETIDRVAAGESVKLIFAFDTDNPDAPRAERLWVTVEASRRMAPSAAAWTTIRNTSATCRWASASSSRRGTSSTPSTTRGKRRSRAMPGAAS